MFSLIVVEVTIKGPVDKNTGMVLNLCDLKIYMDKSIMSVLDHMNLDKDVPFFKDTVSTAENISVFIWNSLRKVLPNPNILYEVKLFETDKNIATFRGEYL